MRTQLFCKLCGKGFYPKSGHLLQKTCGKECRYKYIKINGTTKKGKHYPHTQRATIKECPKCGRTFRAINDSVSYKQKYCGRECWGKRGTKIIVCVCCGKEVKTFVSRKKKYCGFDCKNKDYKIRFIGEKSHLRQGGKTSESKKKRTRSEYREWRTKVFERDKYRCVLCGTNDKTLEADHIKPQSEYPELIYDINNGRTLCHTCHKNTDTYGSKQAKRMRTNTTFK